MRPPPCRQQALAIALLEAAKAAAEAAEQAEKERRVAAAAAEAEAAKVEAERLAAAAATEMERLRILEEAEAQARAREAEIAAHEEAVRARLVEAMSIEARTWIEALLGEPLPEGPLVEQLKSGVVLCNVANAIKPGLCPTPSASKMPFKQMENIGAYLKACEVLKVPPFDTFQTVDLFEGKNTKAVLTNLHSLGRMAQLLPGYSGPVLGAKLATATARTFTEAQLNEAKAAPKFFTAGKQDSSIINDAADKHAQGITPAALAGLIAKRKAAVRQLHRTRCTCDPF